MRKLWDDLASSQEDLKIAFWKPYAIVVSEKKMQDEVFDWNTHYDEMEGKLSLQIEQLLAKLKEK